MLFMLCLRVCLWWYECSVCYVFVCGALFVLCPVRSLGYCICVVVCFIIVLCYVFICDMVCVMCVLCNVICVMCFVSILW